MRVAHLTHYAELYGANRSLLDLVLELRQRSEVEPHVLMPREGPLSERLRKEGVPVRVLPFEPWMSERHYEGRAHHRLRQWWRHERAARARDRTNRALMPALVDQVQAWGTDLLHANSSAVSIATDLASEARVPLVWHVREMPEAHYRLHLDRGRGAHGRHLREADRLVAISEAVKADILLYTTPHRPIEVIYNGVLRRERFLELRTAAADRWNAKGPFTFAQVGLIHPSKGHLEALDALHRVRLQGHDVRLVIAGEGRDAPVRERIATLGLEDAVELAGFLQDPFELFHRAHGLLMCSRHEAMGRVTVEAMATGLPVIGHDSGGTPELIADGTNGLLYPGGADELAERMLRLVRDRQLARRLGERAAMDAAQRFSVEDYADRVLAVFRSVLSERR
ncbi:MAG: glycosyltransferase [Flavobacteriales bacterium]|nr:glycosyltransferase [Flavobacteriales bacterium]